MYKAIVNISNGFQGIYKNRDLNLVHKYQLTIDLIRCLGITLLSKFITINSFYIRTFEYKVSFPNTITFLYLFNEIFCKNQYPPSSKYLKIIDAGANIGLATLWFKIYSPDSKIILFEPDVENLSYLKKNIKENNLTNIQIIPKAISNNNGSTYFYKIKDNIQNLDSGIKLNQSLPNVRYQVKTTKLSQYINSNIDLLKIDIEGSEYSLFDDLIQNRVLKFCKNIYFEAHFFNKKEIANYTNLVSKLKKIGHLTATENSKFTCMNYFTKSK